MKHGEKTMKSLMLIVMIALPTTAFAVDNPRKFAAYKERLAERKAYALEQRRVINATRPPARGWLAIHRPDIDITSSTVSLDRGVVSQPPIPMPTYVGAPYYESFYTTYPLQTVGNAVALTSRLQR
jgi:hypothetical protein